MLILFFGHNYIMG